MQTRQSGGQFSNLFLVIGVNKQNVALKLGEIPRFNILSSYGLY
jgi:hypothetical protein